MSLTTLTYNGYTFDPGMISFRLARRGILGGTNRINYRRDAWSISGRCQAATASAVDAKVLAIENCMRDGGDLVFSLGSSMNLLSGNCVGGTHVRDFAWERGDDGVMGSGAQGVNRRTFTCTIWGDILQTADTPITQWQESLHFIGTGGPEVHPVGSLWGGVQAQQVQAYTPFFAIQSGFAMGLTVRPSPPVPLFTGVSGVFYIPGLCSVTPITPKNWGVNRNTELGVRWSYKCWSSSSVTASPSGF